MSSAAAFSFQTLIEHPLIQRVKELAFSNGGKAYLVGGAVRDWIRQSLDGVEKTPTISEDLDFLLIDCKSALLARQLSGQADGHLVPLDTDFGIHRVVFDNGVVVDLADALDNNLNTDLNRRDLSVNALAVDLQTGELIDYADGVKDLRDGTIRMVHKANLLDDPLRMLRVFRFAACLQANSIDPATLQVIQQNALAIWESAGERIQLEFFRFLSAKQCFPYLQIMADCGLLEVLLPDFTPMRAIKSSGFHHLGLFEHTLELVKQLERLFPELPADVQDLLNQDFQPYVTRCGMLKLACLLHDIGKPSTLGTRQDPVYGERLTFYGHEEVGEKMAVPLLQRFKVSHNAMQYIQKLIRWHLYPCQFTSKSPRKSLLRFYRRMGAETPDVIILALADRHSATGPWLQPGELEEAHNEHLWLLNNYHAEAEVLQCPRLLNGHEIMALLNCGPGPHLKKVMDALQEAQQLQEVSTADEAKQWLLEHASQIGETTSKRNN